MRFCSKACSKKDGRPEAGHEIVSPLQEPGVLKASTLLCKKAIRSLDRLHQHALFSSGASVLPLNRPGELSRSMKLLRPNYSPFCVKFPS